MTSLLPSDIFSFPFLSTALDKIPEAGETSVPPLDEIAETGTATGDDPDGASGEAAAAEDGAQKQEGDSEEGIEI